ncbi:MAG: glycosyltransferase family 4 protein, partial [bacterium]|nr:glycosyltransferase family 4 protein [bacterium]
VTTTQIPMTLLFLTEFFPASADAITGGIEARMWYVTRLLAEKHEVTVIASHQPETEREEIINRVRVLRVGPTYTYTSTGNLFARLRFVIAAWKKGRRQSSDIVEGSTFLTHPIAFFVAQHIGAKSAAWVADVWGWKWLSYGGPFGLLGLFIEQLTLSLPWDVMVCISQVVAQKVKTESIGKNKVMIIPCGIDLAEFPSKPRKKERGLLVWSGRFVEYKRPFFFLDAVKQLSWKDPKIHAVMIGHGPLLLKVQDYIKKEGLFDVVEIKSNLPRKMFVDTLARAQLFVQTSVVEGFGIVVLEALAVYTPVVVPDLPIYREVTAGKGVMFIKANDVNDLADAEKIGWFLGKRNVRDLQREGRKHAETYDWRIIAKETRDKYRAIVRLLHRPM